MATTKKSYLRTRKVDDPYITIIDGDWEWRILKFYRDPRKILSARNPYDRVFAAVRTPHTYGSWQLGDTYVTAIPAFTYALLESMAFLAKPGEKDGTTLTLRERSTT